MVALYSHRAAQVQEAATCQGNPVVVSGFPATVGMTSSTTTSTSDTGRMIERSEVGDLLREVTKARRSDGATAGHGRRRQHYHQVA